MSRSDFNNDGFDDLVIGVPGEAIGTTAGAGAVNVLRGAAAGLTATGNQIFTQGSAGVISDPEFFDNFGLSLAAGDIECSPAFWSQVEVSQSAPRAAGSAPPVTKPK